MGEIFLVAEGLGFPESTRWHDGRVWLCNCSICCVLSSRPIGPKSSGGFPYLRTCLAAAVHAISPGLMASTPHAGTTPDHALRRY